MRQKSKKSRLWGKGLMSLGLTLGFLGLSSASAEARVVTVTSPVAAPGYGTPYYYPGTVVVEPLLLPRTGSNDYIYSHDNVYGLGASAAGRMDRVVVNPQPQLYYPRQQPRVYLGY